MPCDAQAHHTHRTCEGAGSLRLSGAPCLISEKEAGDRPAEGPAGRIAVPESAARCSNCRFPCRCEEMRAGLSPSQTEPVRVSASGPSGFSQAEFLFVMTMYMQPEA